MDSSEALVEFADGTKVEFIVNGNLSALGMNSVGL